ncbi:MAG: TRAP transporter large permease [Clostridiales bacterium]|nr:TRAP transporter large permease [Clostridiales bacterium]
MLLTSFVLFMVFLFLGVPIAFSLGCGSILAILIKGSVSPMLVAQKLFSGVNSFSLMAIPFFMLSGELMEAGGISERLVEIARSFLGHITGGIGMVDIGTSALFAGVSGSAAADTAAVGSMLIPSMLKEGYPAGLAAVIQATAGSLGPIIPPSMTMIIYCSLTGLSIGECFMAGIVPGVIIAVGTALVTYMYAKRLGIKGGKKYTWGERAKAVKDGVFAIIMPVIIIGGIVSGIFTPTESGAIACIYALIVSMFIYKNLKLAQLPAVLLKAASMNGMCLLIVAGASIFSWLVAFEKFPTFVVKTLVGLTDNKYIIMILLVIFLLFVGMFIETLSATIIVAPILMPVAASYGIDSIQFALIMVITLVYAGVTPPVGGVLFITMGIARAKMKDVLPYLVPYLASVCICLLIFIFVPQVALFIPNLLYH